MRWGIYVGIASVFLLGGVAGALLGVTAERSRLRSFDSGNPRPAVDAIVRRLERELKLNPLQSHQARDIYSATRPELQNIERERRRRIRSLLDETEPRVLAILRPDQQQRFRELHGKLRSRLRLGEPGRGAADKTDPPEEARVPPLQLEPQNRPLPAAGGP